MNDCSHCSSLDVSLFFSQGMNLLSSHTLDLVNVKIDNVNNACVPLNLTETILLCSLSKNALDEIEDTEAHVEVRMSNEENIC